MGERRAIYLVRGRSFRRFDPRREIGVVGRLRNDATEQPDIQLDESSISHRHAEWRWGRGGAVELRDPGSRNGSTVGGEPLRGDWQAVAVGQLVDFGSTGRPWTISDAPARGTTEGLTDQSSLLGLHFDEWARRMSAVVAGRDLAVAQGKSADVGRALAVEWIGDRSEGGGGPLDVSDAGWLDRPELQSRVNGDGAFKKSTVAGWIRSLRETLARLDPSLPQLLEERPPHRGPSGRPTYAEIRLRPPPGGFSFSPELNEGG